VGSVERGTHCGDPGSSDLVNTNTCDFTIRVEVCFEGPDGLPTGCGRSSIPPGEGNGGFWTCQENNGVAVAIVLPDDRAGQDCFIASRP
jgi:hypothetical protein